MSRHVHTSAFPILRCLVPLVALVLSMMLMHISAGAQELDPDSPPPARDYVSCGHFESQASAQEALESGNLDDLGVQSLDGDGDGIACEDAFPDSTSPPPARDYVNCGHFGTQEDAQAALDSGNLDELGIQSLDGDGDGVACEEAFANGDDLTPEPAAPVAVQLPNTGAGVVGGHDVNVLALISLIASVTMLGLRRQLMDR